jgi:cell division protein FtsQ
MNRHRAVAPAPGLALGARFGRAFWNASKASLGICLVVGTASATAWGGYRLALSSSRFSIQQIDVENSRRLPDAEVARRAGITPGANLLGLDMHAAEQRLLGDPWIRSVRITRKLPHTLRIELVEHEAVALASLDGEMFLVGADGEPFKAWQLSDAHDFPVLTGVTREDLARDRSGSVARLAMALAVLDHYERLPVSRAQRAQEVHLAPDGSVVLTVGVRGVALHLGQGPWPKKLLMVAEVLRTFEHKRELPGVVFLDNALHPERVVVRMR